MHAYHFSKTDPAAQSSEIFEITDRLAQQLAVTAVERHRTGGTPKIERDLLRDSGLLGLSIPRELGAYALLDKPPRPSFYS